MSDPATPASKEEAKAAALAAYNSVVENAELQDIRLVSLDFSVQPEYYAALRRSPVAKKQLKKVYDSGFSQFAYDSKTKILGGSFDWLITISESRKKLLVVKVSYKVTYRNVPDVGDVHSAAFVRRVGKFATYPYFRALVAQLSWEAKAELPVMPVLK